MPTPNLPLIHFYSILRLLGNTWRKKWSNKYLWGVSRFHIHAATSSRSRWNKHVNKWIMQLISGNGSWRSQMQTKHCSCLYSSICLGSPAGDLGDDSTHMPPSSGLPDFWYFTNPVEIYSSSCSVFWGRTSARLARTCLCSSSSIRGGWLTHDVILKAYHKSPQPGHPAVKNFSFVTNWFQKNDEFPENSDL